MKFNPRVDEYIEKAKPFAQPILRHLRDIVHQACPDVEETIKWGMPSFEYKGFLCGFASFKEHCTFGFWKASLMKDPMLMKNAAREDSMGHLGRIQDLKQLPSNRKLLALVKEAMKLNEDGIKLPKKVKIAKEAPETPDVLLKELKKNSSAMKTFQAFSSSCKKEYIEWITEAKTDATRERRTHQAVEWMAEGKKRNWKYEKC